MFEVSVVCSGDFHFYCNIVISLLMFSFMQHRGSLIPGLRYPRLFLLSLVASCFSPSRIILYVYCVAHPPSLVQIIVFLHAVSSCNLDHLLFKDRFRDFTVSLHFKGVWATSYIHGGICLSLNLTWTPSLPIQFKDSLAPQEDLCTHTSRFHSCNLWTLSSQSLTCCAVIYYNHICTILRYNAWNQCSLMMEAVRTSETSVGIPEDSSEQCYSCLFLWVYPGSRR
jgi:hypothetical protein